jgi:hypothetical protein
LPTHYPARTMIRRAAATAAEVAVLLLAAYTFFFVPVGRRTPFEHVRAIFSTTPAREAADDFGAAGRKLKDKVVHEAVLR